MTKDVNQLIKTYQTKKDEIRERLKEFKEVFNHSDERVFAELAFCICTPQSRATICWNAISSLVKNNLLYIGSAEQMRPYLNEVRFSDSKARYIVEARNFFTREN